jgi:hypothetical protein
MITVPAVPACAHDSCMSMSRPITAIALVLALSTAAHAATFQTTARGINTTGLQSGAPGNAFSFDYRSSISGSAPYDLRQTALIFDGFSVPFSELKVQLDSSPTIFTFLPTPLNSRQVAYTLYDLEVTPTPGGPWPAAPAFMPMLQEWRNETADGILSGHLWVTDPVGSPNQWIFSTSAVFAVPEPAAGVLAFALLPLIRRRRHRNS